MRVRVRVRVRVRLRVRLANPNPNPNPNPNQAAHLPLGRARRVARRAHALEVGVLVAAATAGRRRGAQQPVLHEAEQPRAVGRALPHALAHLVRVRVRVRVRVTLT